MSEPFGRFELTWTDEHLWLVGLASVAAVRVDRAEMCARLEALLDDHVDLPDRNDDDWGVHDVTGARLCEDEYRARKHANRERARHWTTDQRS